MKYVFLIILFLMPSIDGQIKNMEDAVKLLGHSSYKNRVAAVDYLWMVYPRSLELLKNALKKDDPEIRANAQKVLDRIKRGELPDNLETTAVSYFKRNIPEKEVRKKFERYAKAGDLRATLWLARLEMQGKCGFTQNPLNGYKKAKKVIEGVRKLAEGGDSEAQFLIAAALSEKLGIEKDLEKSAQFYEQAIGNGNILALHNYAIMLIFGHGVAPDHSKAKSTLELAVEQGSAVSQAVLDESIFDERQANPERLKKLRSIPLFKVMGMEKDKGLKFLEGKGIITDLENFKRVRTSTGYYLSSWLSFEMDGIRIQYNEQNDRIIQVEGYSKKNPWYKKQYRGALPFDLKWEDTRKTGGEKLGSPVDYGRVKGDKAYGMAYQLGNLNFSMMYSYRDKRELYIIRAFEKWAVNYED